MTENNCKEKPTKNSYKCISTKWKDVKDIKDRLWYDSRGYLQLIAIGNGIFSIHWWNSFFDIYFKYKEKRFLALTFTFILFSINPLIQFFLPTLESLLNTFPNSQSPDLLIFLGIEILGTLSVLLFVMITRSYVTDLSYPIVVVIAFIVIVVPLLTFFLGFFEQAFQLRQFMNILILLSLIPLIYRKWSYFREIANNTPIFIFLAVIIALLNSVFSFFDTDLMIWLEIITLMTISLILPFILINMEYNLIGSQKFKLKDTYSHTLAQILQIMIGEHYLISTQVGDQEDVQKSIKKIDESLKELQALITLIREL